MCGGDYAQGILSVSRWKHAVFVLSVRAAGRSSMRDMSRDTAAFTEFIEYSSMVKTLMAGVDTRFHHMWSTIMFNKAILVSGSNCRPSANSQYLNPVDFLVWAALQHKLYR